MVRLLQILLMSDLCKAFSRQHSNYGHPLIVCPENQYHYINTCTDQPTAVEPVLILNKYVWVQVTQF